MNVRGARNAGHAIAAVRSKAMPPTAASDLIMSSAGGRADADFGGTKRFSQPIDPGPLRLGPAAIQIERGGAVFRERVHREMRLAQQHEARDPARFRELMPDAVQ